MSEKLREKDEHALFS